MVDVLLKRSCYCLALGTGGISGPNYSVARAVLPSNTFSIQLAADFETSETPVRVRERREAARILDPQ